MECRDQAVRQLAQKADRIRKKKFTSVDDQFPRRRVQCGEQPVFGINACIRQKIEQRGFPRVCVPDQRDRSERLLFTALLYKLSALLQVGKSVFQSYDPSADATAIRFKFCFSWAARPDSASQTGKRLPFSLQPRIKILQLRKLNLQFSLARFCVPRKDVQDKRCPIDHFPPVKSRRYIQRLGRGKVPVKKYRHRQSAESYT